MLGAIIGDTVGSIYEWRNIKTKEFPFFKSTCFFTDDSVLTCAVADALMNGGTADNFTDSLRAWARRYPAADYGSGFRHWFGTDSRIGYHSTGNGSAMRVSACGWICRPDERQIGLEAARLSAEATHNSDGGIRGAVATTDCILMCRYYSEGYGVDESGKSLKDRITLDQWKAEIKAHIVKEYKYDLSETLDEIRPTYYYHETCDGTVEPAIVSFLESTDYEDAIRNAISLGGDSDTMAAITGGIAEAAYGIPGWIKEKEFEFLDDTLKELYLKWQKFLEDKKRK
ncbi:MAG: ADP-ribosylglycohydrolase family protein [Clostridiales bacterium]|nr:ADP-ribosylglycohydrolase family protein [Clostridiales bacterium]